MSIYVCVCTNMYMYILDYELKNRQIDIDKKK